MNRTQHFGNQSTGGTRPCIVLRGPVCRQGHPHTYYCRGQFTGRDTHTHSTAWASVQSGSPPHIVLQGLVYSQGYPCTQHCGGQSTGRETPHIQPPSLMLLQHTGKRLQCPHIYTRCHFLWRNPGLCTMSRRDPSSIPKGSWESKSVAPWGGASASSLPPSGSTPEIRAFFTGRN